MEDYILTDPKFRKPIVIVLSINLIRSEYLLFQTLVEKSESWIGWYRHKTPMFEMVEFVMLMVPKVWKANLFAESVDSVKSIVTWSFEIDEPTPVAFANSVLPTVTLPLNSM